MSDPIRAVIDANLIMTAILSDRGAAAKLIEAAQTENKIQRILFPEFSPHDEPLYVVELFS